MVGINSVRAPLPLTSGEGRSVRRQSGVGDDRDGMGAGEAPSPAAVKDSLREGRRAAATPPLSRILWARSGIIQRLPCRCGCFQDRVDYRKKMGQQTRRGRHRTCVLEDSLAAEGLRKPNENLSDSRGAVKRVVGRAGADGRNVWSTARTRPWPEGPTRRGRPRPPPGS